MKWTERLLSVIPGGAHTYSRGFDQFPDNAPPILKRGKGAYIYDQDEKEYLDYGMALRSVILGYANKYVNQAAFKAIEAGNNLTRPSLIEIEAAELFTSIIDSAEMVKFAKNGSNVTTAAVKLARAYTGRKLVARCAQHPFFSFDDWFIGTTVMNKGIPEDISNLTKLFNYNDIESLERLFSEYPNQIACVILEPATGDMEPKENFLQKVKELCHKNGALFILDEMITGFRWHLKGAQFYYNIEPDLCTFGKAMANGFSVAALGGKKEFMRLGSIIPEGQERVFLLSTTHGAEMSGLAAFIATYNFMKENDVISYIWNYGEKLIKIFNSISKDNELDEYLYMTGVPCSPVYYTLDNEKKISSEFRTLFNQELLNKNVLMPWVALSFSHGEKELEKTSEALMHAMKIYRLALENGVQKYLKSKVIKPVFRRHN